MIKKAADLRVNDEVHLKGGKGVIRVINLLEEEESCGESRLFVVSVIPPGCSIGYHRHVGDFETYYLLEGTAKVNDNGHEEILTAGDVLVCYEGHCHGIENIGDTDLKYLAVILYTEK